MDEKQQIPLCWKQAYNLVAIKVKPCKFELMYGLNKKTETESCQAQFI